MKKAFYSLLLCMILALCAFGTSSRADDDISDIEKERDEDEKKKQEAEANAAYVKMLRDTLQGELDEARENMRRLMDEGKNVLLDIDPVEGAD